MFRIGFAVGLFLVLVSGVSAGEFRVPGMRTNDAYFTMAGLNLRLVGRVVTYENDARATFLEGGDFLFEAAEGAEPQPGRYVFAKKGLVCVKFDTGRSRCDTYVRSVNETFMLTSGGKRWKVKSIVQE